MARHVCDNCGSVVGEDQQFCPECGAWIDPTDPGIDDDAGDFEEFSLSGEPPIDRPTAPARFPRSEVQCPSCGSPNPTTNRHCEECGARLSQGPLPVAPRPSVQATAGVRAVLAIAGLLTVVVVIAIVFNIFSGDETDTGVEANGSTTTTTVPPTPETRELNVLRADCSVSGLASLGCDNLIDDAGGEYQINWDELEEGTDVTITLILAERSVITGVVWTNLAADDPGLRQNYRAKDITIDGGAAPVLFELADEGGAQPLQFSAVNTFEIQIVISDAYLPSPTEDRVFSELAIQQIEVFGYPSAEVSAPATSLVIPDETTTTAP